MLSGLTRRGLLSTYSVLAPSPNPLQSCCTAASLISHRLLRDISIMPRPPRLARAASSGGMSSITRAASDAIAASVHSDKAGPGAPTHDRKVRSRALPTVGKPVSTPTLQVTKRRSSRSAPQRTDPEVVIGERQIKEEIGNGAADVKPVLDDKSCSALVATAPTSTRTPARKRKVQAKSPTKTNGLLKSQGSPQASLHPTSPAPPQTNGLREADSLSPAPEDAPPPSKRKRQTKKQKLEDSQDGSVEEEPKVSALERKRLAAFEAHEKWEPAPVQHRNFAEEGSSQRGPFTGRLGYACLNTVLRSTKPPSSKESVFSSRTLRLATIREKGVEAAIELARANINDIIPMLHWNVANNIRFMRLSCEMLPFASHNEVGWEVSVLEPELRRAGDEAKKLGVRLTLHPGQFVQLGTPNQQVLENSIREFEIYCKMLDLMGMGPESVMILHGGGSYGDQASALERIENTITTRLSPSARSRLVLENDEISYSAEELLPLCEKLDVPLVFDWHHDLLRPSSLTPSELLPRILNIWQRRGIKPKFHLSEPRAGAKTHRQRRAHSDRCVELPTELPEDADLMIEAKDKEQAVLELYRIYNLYPVDKMVLRPQADDLTMATAGRRTVLDGSGGATKRSGSPLSGASPRKLTPKEEEAIKVSNAIKKAKAVAERLGRSYDGPREEEDLRAEMEKNLVPASQVRAEMRTAAEKIREDLKAGRPRVAPAPISRENTPTAGVEEE